MMKQAKPPRQRVLNSPAISTPFAVSLCRLESQVAGFHALVIRLARINLYVQIYGAIMQVSMVRKTAILPETRQAQT